MRDAYLQPDPEVLYCHSLILLMIQMYGTIHIFIDQLHYSFLYKSGLCIEKYKTEIPLKI